MVALWPVEHASYARDLGSNPVWSGHPSLKSLRVSDRSVSTTERYFTLSMVRLVVECTRRQRKGNSKKYSYSCWPAWLEMDRKICPKTTSYTKEVELLLFIIILFVFMNTWTSCTCYSSGFIDKQTIYKKCTHMTFTRLYIRREKKHTQVSSFLIFVLRYADDKEEYLNYYCLWVRLVLEDFDVSWLRGCLWDFFILWSLYFSHCRMLAF